MSTILTTDEVAATSKAMRLLQATDAWRNGDLNALTVFLAAENGVELAAKTDPRDIAVIMFGYTCRVMGDLLAVIERLGTR